jgi:hypothetical protein
MLSSMSSDPHQLAPKGPARQSLLPRLGHMDRALVPDREALFASADSICRPPLLLLVACCWYYALEPC